jgi:wyosine [tRNA(Phe)-imidazoG37] synthetase (radical SAM superfamily)
MEHYKYLVKSFSPGPLGTFLAIDLIPDKSCTFDCIFCDSGPTSCKTMCRKEYAPLDAVIEEFSDWVKRDGNADYVVLTGSGEPILHLLFGKLIKFVHKIVDIPVVLSTNASLLHRHDVRMAALLADIVKVSLSAWDHESFNFINRPHQKLYYYKIIDGLMSFCNEFTHELWLEVVVLWGISSLETNIKKLVKIVNTINPDRILVKTAGRVKTESYAKAVPIEKLKRLKTIFANKKMFLSQITLN